MIIKPKHNTILFSIILQCLLPSKFYAQDVKGTCQQWYTSKGHYDNMFNSSSKKVGIGVCHIPRSPYGYYWVFCTAQ